MLRVAEERLMARSPDAPGLRICAYSSRKAGVIGGAKAGSFEPQNEPVDWLSSSNAAQLAEEVFAGCVGATLVVVVRVFMLLDLGFGDECVAGAVGNGKELECCAQFGGGSGSKAHDVSAFFVAWITTMAEAPPGNRQHGDNQPRHGIG
jgi:hypothetical protein